LNACKAFGGKPVEVLNFGVSSYGTAQELLTFRYMASKYSPDLVLVAFFTGNDVRNNSRDLEPDKVRPFFVLDGNGLREDRSFATSDEFRRRTDRLHAILNALRVLRVVQAGYFVKDRLEQRAEQASNEGRQPVEAGLDDAVYSEPSTPQWRDAWTVTERLFAQFRDEVSASGGELVLVTLSTGIQVNPDPVVRQRFMDTLHIRDIFYPDRRVQRAAAALKVRSIMLAPRLQEVAERDKVFLHGFKNAGIGTGHWSELGHRVAADVAAAEMCGPSWQARNDPR